MHQLAWLGKVRHHQVNVTCDHSQLQGFDIGHLQSAGKPEQWPCAWSRLQPDITWLLETQAHLPRPLCHEL